MIHLPRGVAVREKVNPARINLPEAMDKLRATSFSGYLRFDAPEGCGLVIFEKGKLVSALFSTAEQAQRLIAYDAIARIFEVSILGHANLNIYRLSADLALRLHAVLHGRFIYREQDLKLLDLRALLGKIQEDQLNGCLMVYAAGRSALIFYDHGHALGFFHDGGLEVDTTADLSTSVARLPGARVDLLETRSTEELALADLMASADLNPLWQRARKVLLEERRRREEEAIRSFEEEHESRRQRLLAQFKEIAGNHIGKFGGAQVDKAFGLMGQKLSAEDFGRFYEELQRLAKLVAGPSKVAAMIEEMKRSQPHPGSQPGRKG